MYFGGSSQPNSTLAGLSRTFYPKHISYYGNGTGRDGHITMNNGGLNHTDKLGMGHRGIHFARYNSNVQRKSPSPSKAPPTHYYMSDGSGRDGYILKNNGGSRQEYKSREMGDHVFYDSLRSGQRSPLRHQFDPENDRAEITSYLNWPSI